MPYFTSKACSVTSEELWDFILDQQDFVFFWAAQIRRGFSFLKLQGSFTSFCIIFVETAMGNKEDTLSSVLEKSIKQFFKEQNHESYKQRRVISIDRIEDISEEYAHMGMKFYIRDIVGHFKESYLHYNGVGAEDFAEAMHMLDAMVELRSKFNELSGEKYARMIQKYPNLCYNRCGDYHILRKMRNFKKRKYNPKLAPEGHKNL